jgi:hypothetical protein
MTELTKKLIELRKHQRGLDNAVGRIEARLEELFAGGKQEAEMELGTLIRHEKDGKAVWMVEL